MPEDSAAMIYDMFTAYMKAGFTEPQAMYLIGKSIEAASQPVQGG